MGRSWSSPGAPPTPAPPRVAAVSTACESRPCEPNRGVGCPGTPARAAGGSSTAARARRSASKPLLRSARMTLPSPGLPTGPIRLKVCARLGRCYTLVTDATPPGDGCGTSGPARSSDPLAADRAPRRDRAGHRATEAGGDHAQACRLAAGAGGGGPPAARPGVLPEPAVGVDRARVADQGEQGQVVEGVGVRRAAGQVEPFALGERGHHLALGRAVEQLPDEPAGVDAVDVLGHRAHGPG